MYLKIISVAIFLCTCFNTSTGHGRLLDPPSRSSMWRYGFPTTPNYDDNGLNCGGKDVQHGQNGGLCGICGDNFADPLPRNNENGGFYGRGIITKTYRKGGIVPVVVQLTASHLGYFEFSLCDLSNGPETEACFRPITFLGGTSKFIVPSLTASSFALNLQLPKNLVCERCVLRWQYTAGNSLGACGNGKSSVECAVQETFRNCADIKIQ